MCVYSDAALVPNRYLFLSNKNLEIAPWVRTRPAFQQTKTQWNSLRPGFASISTRRVTNLSDNDARVQELAQWLGRDAALYGISDADIDSAIAGSIGAGHGLVDYLSNAMATVANATVPNPQAALLPDEDF